jgi:hypothetical protein
LYDGSNYDAWGRGGIALQPLLRKKALNPPVANIFRVRGITHVVAPLGRNAGNVCDEFQFPKQAKRWRTGRGCYNKLGVDVAAGARRRRVPAFASDYAPKLQQPLPDDSLVIIARGTKEIGVKGWGARSCARTAKGLRLVARKASTPVARFLHIFSIHF